MKKLIIINFLFMSMLGVVFGQGEGAFVTTTLSDLTAFEVGANLGELNSISNSIIEREIEGTVYLFDGWTNNAVIVTSKDQKFRLKNINFNAKENAFESKISQDSLFTFDFANIERIVLKKKTFKNVYSPSDGGYRIYEVIIENKDFEIYKDYAVDIREGNPNPQLGRANDKYIMRDSYYVKKGKSFKKFKLKKSDILKVAGKKSDDIEKYAKDNNLSFKNERDLQKIANYYKTLL